MVYEELFESHESFVCEVCGFHYRKSEQAEDCESFCRKHNACDPNIIADAMENSEA